MPARNHPRLGNGSSNLQIRSGADGALLRASQSRCRRQCRATCRFDCSQEPSSGEKSLVAGRALLGRFTRCVAPGSPDLARAESIRDLRHQGPTLRPQHPHSSKPTLAGALPEKAAMLKVDGSQPPAQFQHLVLHIVAPSLITRERQCPR